jgi:hypothetical protein
MSLLIRFPGAAPRQRTKNLGYLFAKISRREKLPTPARPRCSSARPPFSRGLGRGAAAASLSKRGGRQHLI